MANRFNQQYGFGSVPQHQQPQTQIPNNMNQLLNSCLNNPTQFLADMNINVPEQYQGSPEQMGRYLLNNLPAAQHNPVLQTVNSLMAMFGKR